MFDVFATTSLVMSLMPFDGMGKNGYGVAAAALGMPTDIDDAAKKFVESYPKLVKAQIDRQQAIIDQCVEAGVSETQLGFLRALQDKLVKVGPPDRTGAPLVRTESITFTAVEPALEDVPVEVTPPEVPVEPDDADGAKWFMWKDGLDAPLAAAEDFEIEEPEEVAEPEKPPKPDEPNMLEYLKERLRKPIFHKSAASLTDQFLKQAYLATNHIRSADIAFSLADLKANNERLYAANLERSATTFKTLGKVLDTVDLGGSIATREAQFGGIIATQYDKPVLASRITEGATLLQCGAKPLAIVTKATSAVAAGIGAAASAENYRHYKAAVAALPEIADLLGEENYQALVRFGKNLENLQLAMVAADLTKLTTSIGGLVSKAGDMASVGTPYGPMSAGIAGINAFAGIGRGSISGYYDKAIGKVHSKRPIAGEPLTTADIAAQIKTHGLPAATKMAADRFQQSRIAVGQLKLLSFFLNDLKRDKPGKQSTPDQRLAALRKHIDIDSWFHGHKGVIRRSTSSRTDYKLMNSLLDDAFLHDLLEKPAHVIRNEILDELLESDVGRDAYAELGDEIMREAKRQTSALRLVIDTYFDKPKEPSEPKYTKERVAKFRAWSPEADALYVKCALKILFNKGLKADWVNLRNERAETLFTMARTTETLRHAGPLPTIEELI